MLNINLIQGIRVFLNRVDLKGQEVPAFNQIMMGLAAEEQAIVEEARKAQAAAQAAADAASKKPDLKVVPSANAEATTGDSGA